MMGVNCQDSDYPEFVEVDPTGRYGRYNEILGKGSSKTVYKAFDEYEGIEVAWNQVKLHDFLHCPEDLERLYCEIHLLKTLKHKNIMKFYTSWVDTSNLNINFITEMFTSGTLRQYRLKHRRVNIRAVKHWCREILTGLLYLHSHYPPIIHRDLKCDNILINGNTGEVKIGDLGLAAILRKSHEVHCVGTPEFMAPEVYEEEYNELVDIYSFGMCVLEMVTFEYPYSECTHPAQIYKKVVSGTKPEALHKVEDPEVREFIEKCLVKASKRLSAGELLNDPFLQTDELCSGDTKEELCSMGLIFSQHSLPFSECTDTSMTSGFSSNANELEWENDLDYDFDSTEDNCMDHFSTCKDEHNRNVDITIKGKKREDGTIFLRLRISDKYGCMRNIYFPFDLEADTPLSVATEMVAELDMTDYEAARIADMINGEVSSLVPEWKPGYRIEEMPEIPTSNLCKHCSSNLSSCCLLENSIFSDLQSVHCECAEMHGRFAETTCQVDESESCVTEGIPKLSSSQAGQNFGSQAYRDNELEGEHKKAKHVTSEENYSRTELGNACSSNQQQENQQNMPDDHERNAYRDSKLPNPKHQTKQQKCRSRQLVRSNRIFRQSIDFSNSEHAADNEVLHIVTCNKPLKSLDSKLKSFHLSRNYSYRIPENDANSDATNMTSPTEANYNYR